MHICSTVKRRRPLRLFPYPNPKNASQEPFCCDSDRERRAETWTVSVLTNCLDVLIWFWFF
ncbi:hypothetical protein RchiOBHm_Chr7g0195551 [Rosa chinensis]|uniref:Uncharacterized protein n=1 Tax=Rosa chinensis TaxID=74649 RepID=A0A2P6P6D6_ROSCH|nr:hypothetical protein RchiOBHm_Chr7g0195551 [Rosa chinensis]